MNISHFLKLQRLLMDSLGFTKNDITSEEFMSTLIGLTTEAVELMDLANNKTRAWGTAENGALTYKRVTEEAVDVMFYLLEIFEQLELDEKTIYRAYISKLIVNFARLFASHITDPAERKRVFLNPYDEPKNRSEELAQLDLSSLSIVCNEIEGLDFSVFENDKFFADPVSFAKEIVDERISSPVRIVS